MGDKQLDLLRLTSSGEEALRKIARLQMTHESAERCVVLLATIGEQHVSNILDALILLNKNNRSTLEEALLAKSQDDMHKSWGSIFSWLKSGFGIDFQGSTEAQQFGYCVDLRNAIVHANSSLTRLQLKQFKNSVVTRENFEKHLGVTFAGNRIVMDSSTGPRAVEITRSFIAKFNYAVLQLFPEIHAS
jgi:hypothetical protein